MHVWNYFLSIYPFLTCFFFLLVFLITAVMKWGMASVDKSWPCVNAGPVFIALAVNFQILIITMGVLAGVILIAILVCCCCCCKCEKIGWVSQSTVKKIKEKKKERKPTTMRRRRRKAGGGGTMDSFFRAELGWYGRLQKTASVCGCSLDLRERAAVWDSCPPQLL